MSFPIYAAGRDRGTAIARDIGLADQVDQLIDLVRRTEATLSPWDAPTIAASWVSDDTQPSADHIQRASDAKAFVDALSAWLTTGVLGTATGQDLSLMIAAYRTLGTPDTAGGQ